MAGDFKVYSAQEVQISICGIPITKGGPGGIADGEFLRISWDSEAFTDKVGSDGHVVREKSADERATATLVLMQSSDANDLLSQLLQSDRNSPNGAGVGAFQVRDMQGNTLLQGSKAWVRKPADVAFGKEAGNREWPIRIARLTGTIGGNFGP